MSERENKCPYMSSCPNAAEVDVILKCNHSPDNHARVCQKHLPNYLNGGWEITPVIYSLTVLLKDEKHSLTITTDKKVMLANVEVLDAKILPASASTWQDRVLEEWEELRVRRRALWSFMQSTSFQSVATAEQSRLEKQFQTMQAYSLALRDRIDHFSTPEEV